MIGISVVAVTGWITTMAVDTRGIKSLRVLVYAMKDAMLIMASDIEDRGTQELVLAGLLKRNSPLQWNREALRELNRIGPHPIPKDIQETFRVLVNSDIQISDKISMFSAFRRYLTPERIAEAGQQYGLSFSASLMVWVYCVKEAREIEKNADAFLLDIGAISNA
jgi:hypothetical protein